MMLTLSGERENNSKMQNEPQNLTQLKPELYKVPCKTGIGVC